MPIVRIFRNDERKVVVFREFKDLVETAKKKFKLDEDVELVDVKDGAEIDEDALVPLIELEPNTAVMVLKKGEKWMSPAAAPVRRATDSDTDIISEPEDDDTPDMSLPSTSSAPPMKRSRPQPELSTTDDAAELIRSVLQKSASGATVLAEYRIQKFLNEKSRRLMVNLVVANMMEVHGKTPPTATKRKYAIGIVNLFESLKDPHTPTGHEAFFEEKSNTGFLAARIKNVNRGERRSGQSSVPQSVPCKTDGGPMCKRTLPVLTSNLQSEDDIMTDVNWMKHTPAVSADANMVFEKMKTTLSVRRKLVNDETPAAHIIKEFPQFQVTAGLIEQDFRLIFPDEHPKLLEQWPIIKPKIIALARKSTDVATAELLATVDRGPCEDLELGSWDTETATILLVLCLLPPANHGRLGMTKVPVRKAVEFLIKFEKSGCSIDSFLEKNNTAMQPYLLALGPTKRNISQYFVVIDHIALPCPAHDALGAFDVLFKSHYVFGLQYSKHLLNFWTFLQTTVYQIDVSNTHQTPRVRTLRSKLQE